MQTRDQTTKVMTDGKKLKNLFDYSRLISVLELYLMHITCIFHGHFTYGILGIIEGVHYQANCGYFLVI